MQCSQFAKYVRIVLIKMFSRWFLVLFNAQIQSENDCEVTQKDEDLFANCIQI